MKELLLEGLLHKQRKDQFNFTVNINKRSWTDMSRTALDARRPQCRRQKVSSTLLNTFTITLWREIRQINVLRTFLLKKTKRVALTLT